MQHPEAMGAIVESAFERKEDLMLQLVAGPMDPAHLTMPPGRREGGGVLVEVSRPNLRSDQFFKRTGDYSGVFVSPNMDFCNLFVKASFG